MIYITIFIVVVDIRQTMCADHGDYSKIGTTRSNAKVKQENRRRMGKKVIVSGLRTSDADSEMYAVVTKFFGNGMCQVKCADGAVRMCIIRKKFRGRQKHGNTVSLGATVMVGLRDWEKNERNSLPKCDLLEVYSDAELRKLKQRGAVNLDSLASDLPTYVNELEFEAGDNNGDDNSDDEEVSQQPQRDFDLLNISDNESDNDNDSYDNVDIDDI